MKKTNTFILIGIICSLFFAGIISNFASGSPDGLEKVAEDTGFIETAQDSAVATSPLADYGVSVVENEFLSTGLSGVIGVAVTALVAFGLFKLLKPKQKI
ncbi:MAG: PDGLE domain-containing protein [Candidatus Nanopelagicales bacterium]|jgi:cobalt/nickel transport protein